MGQGFRGAVLAGTREGDPGDEVPRQGVGVCRHHHVEPPVAADPLRKAGAAAPGAFDWIGLALVCFVLPALIAWAVGALMRKAGLIAEGDLLLEA